MSSVKLYYYDICCKEIGLIQASNIPLIFPLINY